VRTHITDERMQDAALIATVGPFGPERFISNEQYVEFESLLPHISHSTKDEFDLLKTTSSSCEEKLEEVLSLLRSLSYTYRLVGHCDLAPDLPLAAQRIRKSDAEAIRESLTNVPALSRDGSPRTIIVRRRSNTSFRWRRVDVS